jgi:1-deoxy-D-xylulose-5-phosphate reductoisomerase
LILKNIFFSDNKIYSMPKRIALLGSTGSIGTQALDIMSKYPDQFVVEVLTAGNNLDLLVEQSKKFLPDTVIISNPAHYKNLKDKLRDLPVKVYAGNDAIEQVVTGDNIDMVLASMVGYAGLKPAISAIKAGKDVALANKETLVVAGHIIRNEIRKSGSRLIPVDSEHSAILQCLAGESGNLIEKITLTASGGPFLNYSLEELEEVSPQEALRHPNWSMGNKITIDSATMMNKGLEVIEAKWLFDLEPAQIEVIIHPQSIIHSFVHFGDGSVKAQLGMPDMRVPILYALTYPDRFLSDLPRLNLSDYNSFIFQPVDLKKFRNLALAYFALKESGNMPCILNAANEVAVDAYLNGDVGFLQMPDIVEYVMNKAEFSSDPDLEFLEISDMNGRKAAQDYINKLGRR